MKSKTPPQRVSLRQSPPAALSRRSQPEQHDPYFNAIKEGDLEAVTQFIQGGQAVDGPNGFGKSGLHVAAMHGHVHLAEFFIGKGADVNFEGFDNRGSFRRTPLHDAASNGQVAMIRYLLSVGARVNDQDGQGSTALHLATLSGNLEAVSVLCESGAQLDARNARADSHVLGKLALELAMNKIAVSPEEATAELLLMSASERQQRLKNTGEDLDNPALELLQQTESQKYEQIALVLIERGAAINMPFENGFPPYLMAYQRQRVVLMEAMLKRLAAEGDEGKESRLKRLGLDCVDAKENTLLHTAATEGEVELINQLCSFDPAATSNNSKACNPGFINAVNKRGRTAVYSAARHGRLEALLCLLEHGADYQLTDNDDDSPLMIADAKGHPDCVALLQEWDRTATAGRPSPVVVVDSSEDEAPSQAPESPKIQSQQSGLEDVRRLMESFLPSAEQCQLISDIKQVFEHQKTDQVPEMLEFFQLLEETRSIEDVCVLKTSAGNTLLHCMASYDSKALLLPVLKKLTPLQISGLLQKKNNNGEMAFHLACFHHHLPLFEFYLAMSENPEALFQIAISANADNGYNAFHLLCVSGYDAEAHRLRALSALAQWPKLPVQRRVVAAPTPHQDLLDIMQRFRVYFAAAVDDLMSSTDRYGNTSLMLCAYLGSAALLQNCLATFHSIDAMMFVVNEPLCSLKVTPLQFLCAFGDALSVKNQLALLGLSRSEVIAEQNLLEWCYFTTFNVDDLEQRQTFLDIMQLFIDLTDKKILGLMQHSNLGAAPLVKSLHQEGLLPEQVLKMKCGSQKYGLLLSLVGDFAAEGVSVSPRTPGRGGYTPRQFPQKPNDRGATLRTRLLAHLLGCRMPEELLGDMAALINSVLAKSPDWIDKCAKEKILSMVINNFARSELRRRSSSRVTTLLTLFYQVTKKAKQPTLIEANLLQQEADYLNNFQTVDSEVFRRTLELYDYLAQTEEKLAEQFLLRIFSSKSLLKTGIAKVFESELKKSMGEDPLLSNNLAQLLKEPELFLSYIKSLFDTARDHLGTARAKPTV